MWVAVKCSWHWRIRNVLLGHCNLFNLEIDILGKGLGWLATSLTPTDALYPIWYSMFIVLSLHGLALIHDSNFQLLDTFFHLLTPSPILAAAILPEPMELAAAASSPRIKKTSSSSSFRLRSPSLNSLRLRRIFDLFDKNGDGMITVQELSQALSLLGLDADFSELESTIKSHIKPGNIGLEYDDFVSLHQSLDSSFFGFDEGSCDQETPCNGVVKMRQEESDLSEAFKVFDEDGDGYISAHELQVVLRKLGLPEAKEIDRVQQMIVSVDRNHDGRVDFFEFKDMMRSVMVRSSWSIRTVLIFLIPLLLFSPCVCVCFFFWWG